MDSGASKRQIPHFQYLCFNDTVYRPAEHVSRPSTQKTREQATHEAQEYRTEYQRFVRLFHAVTKRAYLMYTAEGPVRKGDLFEILASHRLCMQGMPRVDEWLSMRRATVPADVFEKLETQSDRMERSIGLVDEANGWIFELNEIHDRQTSDEQEKARQRRIRQKQFKKDQMQNEQALLAKRCRAIARRHAMHMHKTSVDAVSLVRKDPVLALFGGLDRIRADTHERLQTLEAKIRDVEDRILLRFKTLISLGHPQLESLEQQREQAYSNHVGALVWQYGSQRGHERRQRIQPEPFWTPVRLQQLLDYMPVVSKVIANDSTNPDIVQRALIDDQCGICYGSITDPVQVHGTHVLCLECIVPWIVEHANCPFCRVHLDLENLRQVKIVREGLSQA